MSLNYCPLVRVKIIQGRVALNPHKPAIAKSPCHDFIFPKHNKITNLMKMVLVVTFPLAAFAFHFIV